MFDTGIFLNELYRSRRSLAISAILVVPLMGLFAGLSYMVTGEDVVNLIKSYPDAMLKAFNIDAEMFGTFEGWMSGEPYVMYVLIIGIVAAMMGSSTISKELDQRTSEAVFALPISRKAIFMSKAASHLVQITVLFLLAMLAAIITGLATADVAHPSRVAWMFFIGYLMALAFAGMGYMITSFVDSERSAISLGTGFVLVSFALNAVAAMGKSASWLANFSLFHLLDATVIARGDGLPVVGVIVAAVVYLAGLAGGVLAFSRRDLAV